MKECCFCRRSPEWFHARLVSRREGADHYLLSGWCPKCRVFTQAVGFTHTDKRQEVEAKWDAEAERMLAVYTELWTDPQRAAYRARLFREFGARELPLESVAPTAEQIAATKKWIEDNPGSDADLF